VTSPSPRVGLLTNIDPTDVDAVRVAAVLRYELDRRLRPIRFVLATSADSADPDQVDWRPASPGWSRNCDVVVAFTGAGHDGAIACDLDPSDLADLFDEQIDDVARETRRRVHAHRRWLLPVDSLEVPATALDRQLAVEDDDRGPVSAAVRERLHSLLDALASDVDDSIDRSAVIDDRDAEIAELERQLADERRAHTHTRAALRSALDELDRSAER